MKMARGSMLRATVVTFLVLLVGAHDAIGRGQNRARTALPSYFPYPAALQPQVEFWKNVFATYSKYHVAIHDNKYMKVYKVLNLRPLLDQEGLDPVSAKRLKDRRVQQEMERVRTMLRTLHRRGPRGKTLTAEERKIWELYRDVKEPNKFLRAAARDRLRSQTGMRERFSEGIRISRRYIKEMEEIFRREGLPGELTRLPLIESSFNLNAYSKAGAAGVWQFIRSTGRLYMRIDRAVDERRDPLLATRAAARFLKSNHEKLGTWPLAITAYNHGPAGMARAVEAVGTRDIATIIRSYNGRAFGFASRNFYPEFLAALEIDTNYHQYFAPLQTEPPFRYDEVTLASFLPLKTAARCAHTTPTQLVALNPAFSASVRSGKLYIPRGYRLRVPPGSSPLFLERYAALSHQEKPNSQWAPRYATHTVRRGQSLGLIARRYGTTVSTLKRMNRIRNVNRVYVGQRLRVPARARHAVEKRSGSRVVLHRVRRGQTLALIARRYGTTISTLKRLNNIRNVNRVLVGQRLRVPSS